MFRTHSNVEDGRVRAHETAESATLKVHELIDKVAEGAVVADEKAHELKVSAAAKAALAKEAAESQAADLRSQAEEARDDARKNAKKRRKSAVKKGKKARKRAGKDADDLKQTLVDDVLPKVVETAGALAATGAVAGRKVADEAGTRGPAAYHALKDDHDTEGALAALKGEKRKKKGRKRLVLLALVVGGIAAYFAKQKATPKKDPWAVPAGDPYKAPETGRDSSVGAVPPADSMATADPVTGAPAADPLAAPAALDQDPLATPVAPVADEADARAASEPGEGDAWSSARDWADDSAVPSTSATSEGADLSTDHVGNDELGDGGLDEPRR